VRLRVPPRPRVDARHGELSMIYSADDETRPSERLIDIALEAVAAARQITLEDVSARMPEPPYWPDVWPGEHYRLLAALVQVLRPSVAVEIGTATGLSALAMKAKLPPDGRLITFDIVPWRGYPAGVLVDADFADGRMVQEIDDVSDPEGVERHRGILEDAGLIFIDAAKDGVQEQRFLDLFDALDFKAQPVVVLDDIRQWKMLHIWRAVRRPKLDLTSFGHWSGTGLVDFS
jgi:predicted O-methyltransferase YrrM